MKTSLNKRLIVLSLCFLFIFASIIAADQEEKTVKPPVAEKIPKVLKMHSSERIDNYYWMKEKADQKVLDYLNAENAYTETLMKDTEDLQKTLFEEMKARIKENDFSVPVKIGDYYYYSKTEESKQYNIYCRKKGTLDAAEEIILDVNKLAEGYDYCAVANLRISPDQKLLAYLIDNDGSEQMTLKVKNLETGETLTDEVKNTYYGLEWGNDNKTLFYCILDDALRPYKILRHALGTDSAKDELAYNEQDEMYHVSIGKTRDKKYLVIDSDSSITSEVLILNADNPSGAFKIFSPRRQGIEYYIDHQGDKFLIMTNDSAINFRVMETPDEKTAVENWKEVISHDINVKIEGIDAFKNYVAIYDRKNGLSNIRIWNIKTGEKEYIKPEDEVYSMMPDSDNPEFDTDTLRISYSSLIRPETIYDYNMKTGEKILMKQDEVLGGYNPENYEVKQLWASAADGVKIPMSAVYKKGIKKDGNNPLLLYGYGSYGYSMEPDFSSTAFSLIDRGFVYVIAHIRGGGEMGRPWYENGKFLHKKNTFTDFIACGEQLIADGYTNPDKLVIEGGSAGGLLIGAVLNMRPDLFKTAVASVPFVDVVTTMLDETIPLTAIEWEEWGNPNNREFYDYMLSYSPYDNVEKKAYPNILITAGLNDPRVQYWEPAKWTAKLRAMKTDNHLLLLRTNMGAGHFGASGRYGRLERVAFEMAFILKTLGINK